MPAPTPVIGIIGLGRMGRGVAGNILSKGHRLAILAGPHGTSVEELAKAGAMEVASPVDLARAADIVLTCLPSSAIVQDLVERRDGLLAGASPGFTHLDLTSGDPRVTRQIARRYADRGFSFADLAMSGTPEHALAGRLTLIAGGDKSVLDGVGPLLECFARKIVRAGDVGAGHTTKLITGFLGMAMANASAEVLTFSRAAGVDIRIVHELISETAMNSETFQAMAHAAMDGDFSRRRLTVDSARKDLGYLNGLMTELGIVSSIAPATYQALSLASALGHGSSFVPALTSVLSELNRKALPSMAPDETS